MDEFHEHIREVRVIFQEEYRQNWNQHQPHETSCRLRCALEPGLCILSDRITMPAEKSLYLELRFVVPTTTASKLLSNLPRSNVFHQGGQLASQPFGLSDYSWPSGY